MQLFAGTGDIYPALLSMVQAIFGTEGTDAQHREVIILRAASVLDVPYEWQANEQMARDAGLTSEQIEALSNDDLVTGIGEELELLALATDEMSTSGTLTDPTLQSLLDTFGDVLTEAVPNAWLLGPLGAVRAALLRLRRLSSLDAERLTAAARHRAAVCVAVADGDPETAGRLKHERIQSSLRHVLAVLLDGRSAPFVPPAPSHVDPAALRA